MNSTSSAPGKVILFGEHFVVYGVKALLAAIDRRVTVIAKKIDEKEIKIKSNLGNLVIPKTESINITNSLRPFSYITKKMIDDFDYDGGIDIEIKSEIPIGVGLGSSSACCVATAGAVSGLFTKMSREEILKLAVQAEKTIFERVSGADTTVSTYGGVIEFQKQEGFEKLEMKNNFNFVIVNSKETHSTNKIVSDVNGFSKQNQKIFSTLREKEALLIEEAKIALKNNDLEELGRKMSQNQRYLEKIGVSNDRLSSIIKSAEETSYGAKITGAGGGGCIIVLVDESNLQDTLSHLSNYECFPAKIDPKGLDNF